MTWTVSVQEYESTARATNTAHHDRWTVSSVLVERAIPAQLHVRAIIKIDEQTELKELIASLQKHVKEG